MKLYEYQGREILSRAGIPVPAGHVAASLDELERVRDQLTYPLVVKAQVLVGGRGKAGGIQFADSLDEARRHAASILGMKIKGLTVPRILLVSKLDFARELYAGVLIDRSSRRPLFLVSAEGGVEIESVPDEKIQRRTVDPLRGPTSEDLDALVAPLELEPPLADQLRDVLGKLYEAFRSGDCELLEINPLAVTPDGKLLAADAKAIVNDGALYRHPELEAVDEEYTPLEREARAQNIAFIQLEGRIGVIANGAGLTMATLDALSEFQGRAGVFLDLGGTDDPEQVTRAFRLMKKAAPSVVLINLFGGITKCDTVARGIRQVLDQDGVWCPIVARIKGTNAKEAEEILRDAGLHTARTLQEAAQAAIRIEKDMARGDPPAAVASRGRGR